MNLFFAKILYVCAEMSQIDPFSFFSSVGPQVVGHTTTCSPAVKRTIAEVKSAVAPVFAPNKENQGSTSSHVAKRIRQESADAGEIKCARMPGVNATTAPAAVPNMVEELWVEKYKPKKIDELVGNTASVGKLVHWLKAWSSTTNGSTSVRPGQENPAARAVLISGSPGIGKSSTARLVCEMVGYTVLEFNASDTRSKTAIDELASGLSTNKVLFGNASATMSSRVAIIMDEVDGMAGGDRGGKAALIQLIKKTKLPVICICNDRSDAKVRSLANHCYDLRFLKPTPHEIANRAMVVAKSEQISISMLQLVEIAESTSCDMRQVINHLQMIISSGKVVAGKGQKDESLGPFEIVKGLFTSTTARSWDYAKRNELFFCDYDLTPLLVQQNYLRCVEKVMDPRVLPAIRKANEFITIGDVISRAIHQDSQWALLPEYGVMSTVAPGFACNNALVYPEFPAWLGKQSTTGKNSRLFKDLRTMVGAVSTCTTRNLKLSGYSDVLYETVVGKLSGESGNIQSTIKYLDELGVPKDALFEVLSETRFTWQQDPYAKVDSKTKAALTRNYNSGNHTVRAGISSAKSKKAVGVTDARISRNNEIGGDDREYEEYEGQQATPDDDGDDRLVKAIKPTSKASSKKK